MKKKFKKMAAFMLAAVMCMAMGITSFASGDDFSVTSDASGKVLTPGDQVTVNFSYPSAAEYSETTYYVEIDDEKIYLDANGQAQKTYTVPESAGFEGSYGFFCSLYYVDDEGNETFSGLWDDIYFDVAKSIEITGISFDADAITVGKPAAFSVTVKNNTDTTLENMRVDCCAPWVIERYEYSLTYTSADTLDIAPGQTATVTGTITVSPGTEASTIQFMARIYQGEYVIYTKEKIVNLIYAASSDDNASVENTANQTNDTTQGNKTPDKKTNTTTAEKKAVKDSVPKTGGEAFPVWMLVVAACGLTGMGLSRKKKVY